MLEGLLAPKLDVDAEPRVKAEEAAFVANCLGILLRALPLVCGDTSHGEQAQPAMFFLPCCPADFCTVYFSRSASTFLLRCRPRPQSGIQKTRACPLALRREPRAEGGGAIPRRRNPSNPPASAPRGGEGERDPRRRSRLSRGSRCAREGLPPPGPVRGVIRRRSWRGRHNPGLLRTPEWRPSGRGRRGEACHTSPFPSNPNRMEDDFQVLVILSPRLRSGAKTSASVSCAEEMGHRAMYSSAGGAPRTDRRHCAGVGASRGSKAAACLRPSRDSGAERGGAPRNEGTP